MKKGGGGGGGGGIKTCQFSVFCAVSDLKVVRRYKGMFENTATWLTPMIGKHVLSNNNFVADGK